MNKVAILVDGGFYRKRATSLFGKKDAEARAKELQSYCLEHAKGCELYRIFYYDCPPIEATVYHPFTRKNVNLKRSETYQWTIDFLNSLKKLRKFALRLGRLADSQAAFILNSTSTKKLFEGQIKLDEITESDMQNRWNKVKIFIYTFC